LPATQTSIICNISGRIDTISATSLVCTGSLVSALLLVVTVPSEILAGEVEHHRSRGM